MSDSLRNFFGSVGRSAVQAAAGTAGEYIERRIDGYLGPNGAGTAGVPTVPSNQASITAVVEGRPAPIAVAPSAPQTATQRPATGAPVATVTGQDANKRNTLLLIVGGGLAVVWWMARKGR